MCWRRKYVNLDCFFFFEYLHKKDEKSFLRSMDQYTYVHIDWRVSRHISSNKGNTWNICLDIQASASATSLFVIDLFKFLFRHCVVTSSSDILKFFRWGSRRTYLWKLQSERQVFFSTSRLPRDFWRRILTTVSKSVLVSSLIWINYFLSINLMM